MNVCGIIQVVHGSHGLSPAGPVRDFALRNHSAFPGGVFWLNGRSEFLNGALELVNAVSPTMCSYCTWQRIRGSIISVFTDIIRVNRHNSPTRGHMFANWVLCCFGIPV